MTREIKEKERIIDDSILWDEGLEGNFFKMCLYLTITLKPGILIDPDNFVFFRKKLGSVGFQLSEDGIEPGKEVL